MTILVVDDDPAILKFLKSALPKHGYTAVAVSNAREALSMLSQISVNLIISDVAMPEITGTEFCRIIREKEDEFGYIPIILLTALGSVDDHATGLIAGADDYLTKPIRLKELIAKIGEYAM